MNEKMRSSVMGLILGQFSSPLPMAQKEPVAYLYNGVRLPDIESVWDKENYPYAVVGTSDYDEYDYYCMFIDVEKPVEEANGIKQVFAGAWQPAKRETYALHGTEWAINTNFRVAPIWANYNVLDVDGSVYLEASEPIPVYE